MPFKTAHAHILDTTKPPELLHRHPREGGDPASCDKRRWIPAFAETTNASAKCSLENRPQKPAHLGRIAGDFDTAFLHHGQLLVRCSFATGDNRAGMTHAFAGRCGDAGDEANYGLLHMVLDPARTSLLGIAADLAHHDH